MNNKITAIVVTTVVVLCVAGWFLLAKKDEPDPLPVSDVIVNQEDVVAMPIEPGTYSSDMEFDQPSEETRIILVDPDDGELSGLLAEKVIRDGKIVDKPQSDQ